MLNIGRMGPGRHAYYLAAVADGAEDYYLAAGEEPGRWLGQGAARLELDGRVEADGLRAVLSGADPASGRPLSAHPARRVPGFDLTFRAPKSVSLLWGLGDREAAAEVAAAHDAAVDAAIGYLERAACFTRRGAGGVELLPAEGFVAGAFRHRTSRADDPLLHTHVLVANLAETQDDGIWRTLDSRRLYAHARTAGFLYQAQLRFELTRRLGVAFGPVVNGYADLDQVPRSWVEAFSRRRAAIVDRLEQRGEDSAKAAQAATLATRQAKELHVSEAQLRAGWQRRAIEHGIGPGWHERLLGAASFERPDLGALYRELVDEEALTEQASMFARRDVLRALAERLPGGAPVAYLEQAADAIIAHDPTRVVRLGPLHGHLAAVDAIRREDGTIVPAAGGEPRYTTRGLLLTEQRAVNRALDRLDTDVAPVDARAVERSLRPRSLSGEQAAMVHRLTGSGHGVEVVIGKAGTGKTYALDAARHAWATAGVRVTGVALAARAALELQDSAGIPSTTIARLLGQLDDGRPSPLAPGSVLVVDEAGMVGTRTLARLLDHAKRLEVKVVLVGDPHQLPEIDAGGLFRTLATRLPAIELTDNRRQAHVWEQQALDELRHGDPAAAVAAYKDQGRIVTGEDAEALREQLVADWWGAYQHTGGVEAIMVALRRADVDELNRRARTRLAAAGQLTGPSLEMPDGTMFQAGDRIVCLRNDRRLGVVNGTRATLTHMDPTREELHATGDDGTPLVLPGRYVQAGHLAHGYAITGHKAQGLTVDHTFVLGSPELYREWGYVALSRGRQTNRLYLAAVDQPEDLHHHAPEPTLDETAAVGSRLRRSRAQQAVSEDPTDLAALWRQTYARLHAPDITRQQALTDRRAQLAHQRQADAEQLARVRRRLDQATAGLGRLRKRELRAQLQAEHDLRVQGLDRLDDQLHQLDIELAALPSPQQIADLQVRHRDLTSQLHWTASRTIVGCRHAPPAHLTAALGPPPPDPRGRAQWDQAPAHHRGTPAALDRHRPAPRARRHPYRPAPGRRAPRRREDDRAPPLRADARYTAAAQPHSRAQPVSYPQANVDARSNDPLTRLSTTGSRLGRKDRPCVAPRTATG